MKEQIGITINQYISQKIICSPSPMFSTLKYFVFLPQLFFSMIKRSTIDSVLEAARVEEVIGDFVQLKRSGSSLKGLSPFTNERTPSFMVSPTKQIWKDFSSGKGGNVISFLMEHEHFNYPEAIRYLAKKYGIEVEETEETDEEKEQASERESMYLVNEFAREYFQKTLFESDEGKAIGLTYFKERGFTEEIIRHFQLGYSPDSWEAFTNHALSKAYKLEFLEKTGLTIVKESGVDGSKRKFDRFKGRVMFPIFSMSGRTLGFGGRILANNVKAAKYLNSPESEIYHKSKILYGIYQAKQEIAKRDKCYLVEGYTDVIQFHQSGIINTVASSGTALTPDQIRLINRLTKNIVVLFDGDEAGARASLRGIDLILEQGMNVRVCSFPEGEDPDSFAKSHTEEELREFLDQNEKDFISYKASLLMKEARHDPIKKAEVIRDMMKSVSLIPDDIKQELYLKEIHQLMDVSQNVLFSTLAQIKAKDRRDRFKEERRKTGSFEVIKNEPDPELKVDAQYELERKIISLLLMHGAKEGRFEEFRIVEDNGELKTVSFFENYKVYQKIYKELQEDEMEFTNHEFRDLYKTIMDELTQKDDLEVEEFIKGIDIDLVPEITSILMDQEKYKLSRWESHNIFVKDLNHLKEMEVQQTILSLRLMMIYKKIEEMSRPPEEEENSFEVDTEVLSDIIMYQKLQVLIARTLDSVKRGF